MKNMGAAKINSTINSTSAPSEIIVYFYQDIDLLNRRIAIYLVELGSSLLVSYLTRLNMQQESGIIRLTDEKRVIVHTSISALISQILYFAI